MEQKKAVAGSEKENPETRPTVSDSEAVASLSETIIPETPLEQLALEGILRILFQTTNVDFSHYRQTTVLRRMVRRMALLKFNSYTEYLGFIETNADEIELLYDDLLISYTEFFREPDVFDTLKNKVFPALLEHHSAKMPIRIWVPGCSTGEEVYSLAICFQEFLQESNFNTNVKAQFFGTDLNARHIAHARTAIYPDRVRKNISSERLEQYFDQTAQGLKVTKYIRELCIFAVQNIIQDAPFSNMDMVSCRNVLIYFDSAFQETVIPLFHFSLRQNGYLLLGSSESMGRFPDLFTTVESKANLYSKRFSPAKSVLRFPINHFSMKMKEDSGNIPEMTNNNKDCGDIGKQIDNILLTSFAPPSVLVDSSLMIRQFRGPMFPFLQPATGEASLRLSKMAGEGLMPELYLAIEEAKKKRTKITKKEIAFRHNETIAVVDISVIPVLDHIIGEPCFLIIFEKTNTSQTSETFDLPIDSTHNDELARLKYELQSTKEHLQAIIEEKDDVNQALWASSEEVQSSNEELQSVNEEMEAAKEELESSNEELMALNEELRAKTIELNNAKDFSENIVDTAKAIVITLDTKGIITTFNNYAAELTGYKKNDVLGRNWFDIFISSTDRISINEVFIKLLENQPDSLLCENNILTKKGTPKLIRWSNCLLRDCSGNISGVLSIGMDITFYKQGEDALRESEERFHALFEHAPLGYQSLDSEGRFIIVNQAWLETLGFSREEVIGKWFGDFLAPEYVDAFRERFPVFKENGKIHYEFYMIHKNGERRFISFEGRIAHNADGSFKQTHCILSDETDRKRTEEKLRESEFFFKESQRAAFIGSYKTDFKTGFWESSEILDCIFGIDKNYCRSVQGWLDIVHPEDAVMMDRYLREDVINKRKPFNKEYRIIRKTDGEIRWVNGLGKVEFDIDGNIVSMIGTIQDITERRRIDMALQSSQKLESLGILAGGIAHDFNNLLGGIFGSIDLAEEECRGTKASQYLLKALSTIDRAKGLTQQLITFAVGGAPVRVPGKYFPLVHDVALFALSGSNVSINFNVNPDLWQGNFDKNQISQVIENIIINAVQAMPAGGSIILSAENVALCENEVHDLCSGNYTKISIQDTGVGIPLDIISRIFDPFFSTKGMGRGLGLSTCYSIVKRHSGHITVISEPGKGSTFNIYLPAAKESVAENASLRLPMHLGNGRILIMDDEEVIRETVSDMLKKFSYTVVMSNNGQDALNVFRQELASGNLFTAIILDLTVPGGFGGKEIITEIRMLDKSVPVFVASGYADDPAMIDPKGYGFTDSIQKPFRKSELSELLEKNLKKG